MSDTSEEETQVKMEPSSSDESSLTSDSDDTSARDRVSPFPASKEVDLPSCVQEKEDQTRGRPPEDSELLDSVTSSADGSTDSSRDDDDDDNTDDDHAGSGADDTADDDASKEISEQSCHEISRQRPVRENEKARKGDGRESGESCDESSINDWDMQIYRCMKCGMAFSQHNHLVKHLLVHTFKCKQCGQQFSSDEDLLEHEDSHRVGKPQQTPEKSDQRPGKSQVQKHVCHECDLEFCNVAELLSHWGKHIFACSFCRRTFTSHAGLLKHESEHTQADFSCKDCGKVFQRVSNLKVHMMKYCQGNPGSADGTDSENDSEDDKSKAKEPVGQKNLFDLFKLPVKEEVLDEEGTSGQAQSSLPHHSNTCHDVEVDDSDDDVIICGETYTEPPRNSVYFNCSKCPQAFSRESDFVRHMKTHSSEKPKKSCSEAAKKIASPGRRHEASSSDFKCETCQISFATERDLQKHMSKHKYLCDKCDQTFTSIKKLKHHIALHNADQTHECSICHRQYAKASFLQRHIFLRHPNAKRVSSQQRRKAQVTSGGEKVPSKSHVVQKNVPSKFVPSSPKRILASPRKDHASGGHNTQTGSPSKKRKFASLSDKELYTMVDPAEHQVTARHAQFTCKPCKKSYSRKGDLTKHLTKVHAMKFTGHKFPDSLGPTKETLDAVQKRRSPSKVAAITGKHKRQEVEQKEVSETADIKSGDQDRKSRKQGLPQGNSKSSSHKVKTDFTCKKCGKSFSSRGDCERHKNSGVFMCPKCQRFFTTCASLKEHKLSYHGQVNNSQGKGVRDAEEENGKGVKVKITGKGREETSVVSVSEQRDQQLQCGTCKKQFKRRCDLSRHASSCQVLSSDDDSETENTVSLPSRRQQGLRSSDHALSNTGRRWSDSRRDSVEAAGPAKPVFSPKRPVPVALKFTCNVCSKAFKELEELTKHQQVAKHTAGRKRKAPPPAAAVGAAASSSNEEYSCELCQEVFSTEAELEEHQEYHTLSEFGSEAKDEWDETIVSQRSLMVKRKKELREELFICRFCDQTFSSLEHVHRHERSHPYLTS
ncbi:uncharacterized protein [Diadema antillarum]|uniref:uncharacterized protein n=1 Tax=Diadema antillarum TaxID=105358 RepID=UPI003A8C1D1A